MKTRILFRLVSTVLPLLTLFFAGSPARAGSSPLTVGFYYPTNGESYLAPATIGIHALVLDTNEVVTVQYFAGSNSLAILTNRTGVIVTNSSQGNPFEFAWSNVLAGSYSLTAVAADGAGNIVTSAPVNITVTNAPPPPPPHPVVYIYSPTNNEGYRAPATIGIYARSVETGGTIAYVTFVANSNVLGVASNSMAYSNISSEPLFALTWSNVLAGVYSITAIATDSNGVSATSAPVTISVTNPPVVPFTVSFYYPTNGQSYLAPANVALHALVLDSNVVETVEYFAGTNLITTVTNKSGVLLTSSTQANPFEFTWSNVLAGSYSLTAVAVDSAGATATSAPVNIIVTNPPPPPPVPFAVSFYYPVNGQIYTAPASVALHARVTDSNAVETVAYFAGSNIIGIVTNKSGVLLTNTTGGNPFELTWSNVPAGAYVLTAVATDSAGATATSATVNILITNPPPPPPVPFAVSFFYPTNGEIFVAPVSVGVHARVTDSNVVETMQYFANGVSIGTVSNTSGVTLTNSTESNPFFLAWSNVPAGYYALTAMATDSAGATATSLPVDIWVVTNAVPVVRIYAPDPVAVPGTNGGACYVPTNCFTNYCTGSNTATFLVKRDGATNTGLTVNYIIGGTATNGVDYDTIPTNVTILPGQTYALVTIVPIMINQTNPPYDTVTLTLAPLPPSTKTPPAYVVGSPSQAGAVIIEDTMLPIPQPLAHSFPDGSVHVSLPASDGLNMILQTSPDLVHWTSVCTNTVLKGSSQYVDPSASANRAMFYRVVVSAVEPSY